MSQFFQIHPENPQQRLVAQAVAILRQSGVVVYPTDSCYALGCHLGDKSAMTRIQRIRRLDDDHDFTLVCRDLSEAAVYAHIDNPSFRLLKALTPGAYTFILRATGEVPRRLLNPKRRTIGVRIPDHRIVHALLESLGEPIMSTTLQLPGEDLPMADPDDIRERLGHAVDLIIDGGAVGMEPTTVVDLTGPEPQVVREGKGDIRPFTD